MRRASLTTAAACAAIAAAAAVGPAAAITSRAGAGALQGRALVHRSRPHDGRTGGVSEYGCPVLPESDPLNREVTRWPVSPRSARYIASIGAGVHLHADFGTEREYGIPYTVVGRRQRKVPIRFTEYGEESNRGPYPVPRNAPVEGAGRAGSGDKHVLVLQEGSCRLYEMWNARRAGRGWLAGSGAIFNLRSAALRPEGWTSADAAGLPIFPLLARYPEIAGTRRIDHALRVTVPETQRAYIHPATHFASGNSDPNLPPMGLRLRLKASFSLAGFSGQSRVILEALKRYGLIVADNGSPWFITGAPSAGWDDENLQQLGRVPGSAFEALESGPIHR